MAFFILRNILLLSDEIEISDPYRSFLLFLTSLLVFVAVEMLIMMVLSIVQVCKKEQAHTDSLRIVKDNQSKIRIQFIFFSLAFIAIQILSAFYLPKEDFIIEKPFVPLLSSNDTCFISQCAKCDDKYADVCVECNDGLTLQNGECTLIQILSLRECPKGKYSHLDEATNTTSCKNCS